MAVHDLSNIRAFVSGPVRAQAICALIFCLLLLVTLILWRRRSVRAPVRDMEKRMSDSEGWKDTRMEKMDIEPPGLPPSKGTKPLSALAVPFVPRQGRMVKPSPSTSGNLTAKAEIENPSIAVQMNHDRRDPGPSTDVQTLEVPSTASASFGGGEDQQAPWRRHSYPLTQNSSGVLHRVSQHDQTERFSDPSNPGVIWRRRTLVFGTEEPPRS